MPAAVSRTNRILRDWRPIRKYLIFNRYDICVISSDIYDDYIYLDDMRAHFVLFLNQIDITIIFKVVYSLHINLSQHCAIDSLFQVSTEIAYGLVVIGNMRKKLSCVLF